MSQIESSYSKFKKISWAWLFSALLAFVTIFSQVLSTYQVQPNKQNKYLQEKIILDQVLLQKTQEKIGNPTVNPRKSKFNSLLDSPVSSLIENKDKNLEAAVLYALMRYEQGYKVSTSDILLLANQENLRYSSIYKIYTQDNPNREQFKYFFSLFQENNIVDRLIRVHIYEKLGHFKQREEILPLQYWSPLLQVTGGYMLAGIIGMILLLIYQYQRKKGKHVPIGLPFIPANFNEFNRQGKNVILIAFLFPILQIILSLLKDVLGLFIGITLLLVISLFFFRWPEKSLIRVLKGKTDLLSPIKWGVGASFVNIPVMGFFGLLSFLLQSFFPAMSHSVTDVILSSQNLNTIIVMALLACIIAPIMEEILFRGIILPCLIYRYKSPLWGIIITNFIFAAIHPQGIAGWPALFAVGCMTSLIFIQTGSIISPIILHMIHNTGLLVLTYTLSLHL